MKKGIIIIIALVTLGAFTSNAQKFGHVSSIEVLDSIQSYKDIQTESEKIQMSAQEVYKGIEAQIIQIQKDAQVGYDTLDDFSKSMIQSELDQKQGFIQQLEYETQKDLQVLEERMFKLTELYKEAIKIVAEREGITYVFDDQSGLLYAGPAGLNLTDKVITELLKLDNANPIHRFP